MKLQKNRLGKKQYDKLTVFLIAFIALYVAYLVSQILCIHVFKIADDNRDFYFHDINDYFMDYFNPLFFSANKNPYTFSTLGASYPPLCYVLYRIVLLFIPAADPPSGFWLREKRLFLMSYVVITLLLAAFVLFIIDDKFKTKKKYLLGAGLLLSFPMLYVIERGNILLLSFVLLLFFVLYRDSENKYVRELSLLALAVSAAVKIYPAIFGILLFFDERIDFKRIVRCMVYGFLFFAVPFFFFDGINTMKDFINNVFYAGKATVFGGFTAYTRLDVKAFFYLLANLLPGGGLSIAAIERIAKGAILVLSAVVVLYVLFVKSNWKKSLGLTTLTIIIPSFSYTYCSLFLLIPLILWLLEKEEKTILGNLMIALIVLIIVPLPFISNSLKILLLLHAVYGLMFLDLIFAVKESFAAKRKKRIKAQAKIQEPAE